MAPQLCVLAGSSRGDLRPLAVNRDQTEPFAIKTDHFQGELTVRIREFAGPGGIAVPESGYFEAHPENTYSIFVSGCFTSPVSADELVFGNIFEKPIRDSLPYGTSAALKAMHFIDPALQHDVWSDRPWAWSPFLATMNLCNVQHLQGSSGVPGWSADLPGEDCSALLGHDPGDSAARRKYFSSPAHRQAVTLTPEHFVRAEFANGLLDFNTLSVILPFAGLKFSLANLWKGNRQDVTYVCRNTRDDYEYFVVVFRVVDPDLIAEADASSPSQSKAREPGAGNGLASQPDDEDYDGVD